MRGLEPEPHLYHVVMSRRPSLGNLTGGRMFRKAPNKPKPKRL